jgi:hypothetical protein
MMPHKHPFLVGRVVIIPTPQYYTATLKENHYVQQSLQPQHLSNASLALTSSSVNDQRQLKTIVESHVSSAVASAEVGGLNSPTSNSEIEAGPIVSELGK